MQPLAHVAGKLYEGVHGVDAVALLGLVAAYALLVPLIAQLVEELNVGLLLVLED